mmetsp:Transcript_34466/g.74896  ORF Transcript_34466/g.74896 Transcript_34466/m.74896 type:complete len:341 (+) Transcript_34466:55-1077(+)
MRSFCMVGHGYQRGLRRNCLPGYRAERVEAEAEDLRPRHRAFQLTLRCADPMPTRDAPGSRLLHKPAPGGVVPLDEAQGPCNVVHFEMQGSLVAAASAALLEVVNPVQALLHAARGQALHVCDGARACQWPLPIHVHHQHLPIGLALVDEADRAQWQAAHHSADTGRCIAKVEHVQRVIVTGGPVELIFQLWVPKGPWEAAVIEGNGPAEGSELLRALGILLDGVLRHVRLHLELLQSAHRHFVDVVEERRGLVQPCLHMELHVVPERYLRGWGRDVAGGHLLAGGWGCRDCLGRNPDASAARSPAQPRLLPAPAPRYGDASQHRSCQAFKPCQPDRSGR